jgi:archaellum component FlaC
MKILLLFILGIALLSWSCDNKSNDHSSHHDDVEQGGNQELYDDVMDIHDEVMPKMDDIYKLKEKLKNQLTDAPNMAEEKRREIETIISRLEAASEGMMVWMRNFNPLPDSLGEEKARKYLEEQKEKVTKVKEDMLGAIEDAKEMN